MRRPKYSLEPLLALRERQADDAARELASAVARRDEAERLRKGAEERRASREADARTLACGEAGALARGELRVADLARAGAWEVRVAAERARQDEVIDRARKDEGKAREVEAAAKGRVAASRADADVVTNDRAKWSKAQRKREEAKEEEAASEAWRRRRD